MAAETLIIVVGGDYLALEICRDILHTSGHRVVLLWEHEDDAFDRKVAREARALAEQFGTLFRLHAEDPTEPGALERAGLRPRTSDEPCAAIGNSTCLVAVASDDRLNLRVALAARDLDVTVRITLRQFNPILGHKVQEALQKSCTVVSPAAQAAATYAAAAVDPDCVYALPFPVLETLLSRAAHRRNAIDTPSEFNEWTVSRLYGFSERDAVDFGIAGMYVPDAELQMKARIVAVNGRFPYLCHAGDAHPDAELLAKQLEPQDRLVVFGPVRRLRDSRLDPFERAETLLSRITDAWSGLVRSIRRTEPLLRNVLLASIALYVTFVAYFSAALHLTIPAAMYFVMATMATVGYGDITPCNNCATQANFGPRDVLLVAMFAMVVGLSIFAVFTATLTSSLNSAKTRLLQGLRHIYRRGHIIVCGAGNVGSLVIDYLREMGEQVVVIESNPDSLLIELARERKIDLLTGDAASDDAIGYAAPERARCLVGVTNSDTVNLEAALGARSRTRARGQEPLNVVLRIDDLVFGSSIQRHFGINSFSTTELSAPTIAGLARFESTRARLGLFSGTPFAGRFQLFERTQDERNQPPPAPPERPGYKVRWIPLYVWREDGDGSGKTRRIRDFSEILPGDRVLAMVPLDQFAKAGEAAPVEKHPAYTI